MPDDREEALRVVEAELQKLIGRVRRQVADAAERLSPGLPPIAFKVFAAIARLGPVSSSRLAETLSVDKGLLSRSVSQLEQLGLVVRRADPGDGRVSLLSASAEGARRLASIRRPGDDPLAAATAEWDVAQLRTFAVLLRALGDRSVPGPFDELADSARLPEVVTSA